MKNYLVLTVLIGIVCGGISGRIALRKGYTYWPYFFLGLLLSVIGVVVVLLMQDKSGGSSGTMGKADELLKYKQLLDAGAITQREFNQKKSELLVSGAPSSSNSSKDKEITDSDKTRMIIGAALLLVVILFLILG